MGAVRKLMDWIKLAVCVVLVFPLLIYFLQERLIFFPQPLASDPLRDHPDGRIEAVSLDAGEEIALHGWLAKADGGPAPVLIYFGGNAEEVSWLAATARRYAGWSLLLFNYRGYGASGGKPSEAALFDDALRIYDYARARAAGGRVAVMGRSLGSGVAVYLASQRPLAGVILVSPYDSVERVAEGVYPYLPIRLMLKHRFDSIARAPMIKAPLLCLAASDDSVIPLAHSERLFAAWGGAKRWQLIAPAAHDSIAERAEYWRAIEAFLRSAQAPEA